VLVSPEVSGEVWTHFSQIVSDDENGYRSLSDGQRVRFAYEHYPPGQDGYYSRAVWVVAISEDSEYATLTEEEIVDRIRQIDERTVRLAMMTPTRSPRGSTCSRCLSPTTLLVARRRRADLSGLIESGRTPLGLASWHGRLSLVAQQSSGAGMRAPGPSRRSAKLRGR
jgi:cold shock CspA family protein